MMIIRPVAMKDLEDLVALAEETGYGLTTLPRDRNFLKKRIRESEINFQRMEESDLTELSSRAYLFVLEDLEFRRVVGTSAIVPKVGGFEPFYAYRIKTVVHASEITGTRKEIKTLHLVAEHSGPCEIGSLFLSRKYRLKNIGRFLSLARFLFMAEHPNGFDRTVIAEIRGVIDESGHPPFWSAVGRHFFDIDFQQSDYLALLNKKIIADLMPTVPIYIPLLPKEAQAVIGVPHKDSAGALRILEEEGMHQSGMVDIFDAGPILVADRDEIRTVRESARYRLEDLVQKEPMMIGTTSGEFRACLGGANEAAQAFGIGKKDWVRAAPLRPS